MVVYKVIVLGDSGVGKTSLLHQYAKGVFNQQYKATIGSDFLSKEVYLDDKVAKLQIWDTAGQERFRSLADTFYRGTNCCVLVYDICDPKSFESLDNWKELFVNHTKDTDETSSIVLIGNKVDRESERKVPKAKAEEWCKINGNIQYFETSAKDNINLEEAFNYVAVVSGKENENANVGLIKLADTENPNDGQNPTQQNQENSGCKC